jgi:hypothetical protein
VRDKIKICFIYLMNAIQAGKIYTGDHPKFKEYLNRLYGVVQEILEDRKELVLGIIGGEAAWEDEIFFNLRGKLGLLIDFLEKNGVERIIFQQGLRFEELREFIIFLTRVKRQEKISEQEYFSLHGIQNIRAGKLRTLVKGEGAAAEVEETRTRYESSVQTVSNALNVVLEKEEVDYLDLRFNILGIMEDFVGRHQELLNLVSVKRRDLVTFVHLLNVTLLGMFAEAAVRRTTSSTGHRRSTRRRQALHLAQGHPEGVEALRRRVPSGPQPSSSRSQDPRGLQGRPGHPADRHLLRTSPPP